MTNDTPLAFPIVGVGASAGGLAAFEAFFSGMPQGTDPGMAFVLVQHLAPDHKSILSDLVKRYTRMQVFEVEDGVAIKPNCVYIIPPNRDMALLHGTLQLLEQSAPRGQRLPIDHFFRSLAEDQRERAICIVLSGTGSDGTLGLRAVKGDGGMAMVQNPESTEYDGMPRTAIATGLADYVLPPAEMPPQLIAYVAHAFGIKPHPVLLPAPKAEDALKKVFILVRTQTGHDFSQYKENTITRRIERRMAVHQIAEIDDYVRYLQRESAEVTMLFRDFLIGVTNFFREPESFAKLETEVIPKLAADKTMGDSLRIWVPGCSSGEEAYSIAILIEEHLEAQKKNLQVQIFATDIDAKAIEQARAGLYPASIAADVTPERLARFFAQEPGQGVYRVHKTIRDMLVFSEHDVIKDPPFSRLDLISCRNLLIYMGGELQRKVIPLFHYALCPGGVLFLGTSETVGEFTDIFATIDRESKLYRRNDDVLGLRRAAIGNFLPAFGAEKVAPRRKAPAETPPEPREVTVDALLRRYAPSGALVDEHGEIRYLHGRTGEFLEPSPGDAGMNILRMAREGLRRELTTALHRSVTERQAVRRTGVRVKSNGDFATINLEVVPILPNAGAGFEAMRFLVAFEPQGEATAADGALPEVSAGLGDAGVDARILALEQELRAKEEYLQSTNEELESSNEELRSSNEEMQSVNEELQSTNEELESSKEELQSLNEELATVNAELQQKVGDLTRAMNDMNNLLAGTGVGTIFVDLQARILRFTPLAAQMVNLILTDIGRPLGHIVTNLVGYDRLADDVRAVLDSLIPIATEVETKAGVWCSLRIRPYRTIDNVIEGAVITLIDINEIKGVREELRLSEGRNVLAKEEQNEKHR